MSQEIHLMARALMEFQEVNPTMIANEVGIGRTNIYSWLKGKQRTLSEQSVIKLLEYLGVSAGELSRKTVHRWKVDSVESIKRCLEALFSLDKLRQIEITDVNCDTRHFNILRIPDSNLGDTTILLAPSSQLSIGYLMSSKVLGYGKDMDGIEMDISQWNKWWDSRPLLAAHDFWLTADPFLKHKVKPTIYGDGLNDPQILKERYQKMFIEKTAENAGLRAVIRSILRALREKDPGNEWLNDERRNWIYNEFYQQEKEKLSNSSLSNSI